MTTFKSDSVANTCQLCHVQFFSRNRLFTHLNTCKGVESCVSTIKLSQSEENNTDAAGRVPLDHLIEVLAEDEWFRIICKPQGLATMGQPRSITVLNSDKMFIKNNKVKYKKAVPCHRLDRSTGGLMICSKSKLSEGTIMTAFRNKHVCKEYVAVVIGCVEPSAGLISMPIMKKMSFTIYKVKRYTSSKSFGVLTTISLWPITGRKHQLRKHLQAIGHPIVGDKRYSHAAFWPDETLVPNFLLWSVGISFPHPIDYHIYLRMKKSASKIISPELLLYKNSDKVDSMHCSNKKRPFDSTNLPNTMSILDNNLQKVIPIINSEVTSERNSSEQLMDIQSAIEIFQQNQSVQLSIDWSFLPQHEYVEDDNELTDDTKIASILDTDDEVSSRPTIRPILSEICNEFSIKLVQNFVLMNGEPHYIKQKELVLNQVWKVRRITVQIEEPKCFQDYLLTEQLVPK